MDPILTTIGIAAVTAFVVDVANDRFEPLRNLTHGNIMSESTKQLTARLDEILADPELLKDYTAKRSRSSENSSGFNPAEN
jgi:hypothetical protein